MHKNHDEFSNPALFMSAAQADEDDSLSSGKRECEESDEYPDAADTPESGHITVVPFSTTKTGSFQ